MSSRQRGSSGEFPSDLSVRMALRPREAAEALGVSERTIREVLPEIPHTHLGACVVIPVHSLRAWLDKKVSQDARGDVSLEILELIESKQG